MKKSIKLYSEDITYEVRTSSRARCLRITVYPGGELTATLPRSFSTEKLENFLRQKANWVLKKIKQARKRKPKFLLPRLSRREYLEYKEQARNLAERKIRELNQFYGFHCNRISIRNQKTRWGSCSRKGNLNFNYRIVHLPEKYLNYLVAHELCHLKEFNHSPRFWDLIAQTIPDYKSIRREFRNL